MTIAHTLIVPVHNGSRFIHLFWQSVFENLPENAELIVIDDASTERREQLIPEFPSGLDVEILTNDVSQGYSRAVNRGLRAARGSTIYLLNTDLILGDGALDLIDRTLRDDPSIGVVGAKLLYPQTGKIQHFGLAFSRTRKFHIYTHMDPTHPLVSELREFQAVTFALCGFRREVLDQVGLLDGSYCNGCEDIDYCLRVRAHGYRTVVAPDVTSYHWESLSGESRHLITLENESRFWGRWADEIEPDMGAYIRPALAHFADREALSDWFGHTVVNLTPGSDFEHILNALAPSAPDDLEVWDYTRSGMYRGGYWLPMVLPADSIRHPKPLLFVVKEFPMLLQNHYWAELRARFSPKDVVLDHYGNIDSLQALIRSSTASRLKVAMDAS